MSKDTERKALIDANMSITGAQETVTVKIVHPDKNYVTITYPNGYKETMMVSALTFIN
jgi:hypothetical protein